MRQRDNGMITCALACFFTFYLMVAALPVSGFDGLDVAAISKQAAEGDADAQSKLGVLYASGVGIEKNPVLAASWYRRSAEQGNPVGQWNLAFLYVRGEGVAADLKQARALFRKAAESGLVNAQYDLGMMLLNGMGGAEDKDEAMKWFRSAAARGYREAKKILKELDAP